MTIAPDALRRQLDDAAAARPYTPAVVTGGLALAVAVVAGTDLSVPATTAVLLAVAVLAAVTRRRDRARRTVVVPVGSGPRHEQLVATWERLRCAATSWEPAVWEVAPHGGHAPVARRLDGPRHLRAAGPVPTFAGTRRELAFLPGHVVLRDGRFHTVVGYDALEVDASVHERAGGGRLGRLTVRAAGLTSVYDLASVDAACATAAALRGLTDAHVRPAPEAERPARTAARNASRDRAVTDARARLAAVPAPRQARDATGRSWASPTAAL